MRSCPAIDVFAAFSSVVFKLLSVNLSNFLKMKLIFTQYRLPGLVIWSKYDLGAF